MSTQSRTKMPTDRSTQVSNAATQPMPTMPAEARSAPHVPPEVAGPMPGTETKPALRATELYIYLIAVAGVLVAAQLVGRNSAGVDVLRADRAWWYITVLTVGYLISRGLAKAGSSWRHSRERAGR